MKYKIIFWIFIGLLFGAAAYGSFFAYKIYSISKKVNITNTDPTFLATLKSFSTSDSSINLRGANQEQINVLLLGMAGKGKPGQYLTDTIMIASVDLKTNRVSLLSLPRDLHVKIPESDIQTKINSVYQIGLSSQKQDPLLAAEVIKETVFDITGMEINYFVILNFDGFQKAIDDIGGVNIMNGRDIIDTRYPGPNYSYETFALPEGFHRLDGATALKYARVRHGDPEGDFGRAKRQQQIMQAAKSKIFSTGTLFNAFTVNALLNTLGENIQTDISTEELAGFFELAKKLDTQNINNVVIDAWNKDSLLKVSHVQYGAVRAFVLVPRVGNYSEIRELAKNIFNLAELKRKQEEISKEDASITIINRSGNAKIITNLKKVLQENLNYKNVAVLSERSATLSEKTVAYDLTDGQKPFTLNALATKLPAEVSYENTEEFNSLKQNTADIILIIGKDLIDRYNIEEGTLEDLNRANDDQESAEYNKN